MTTATALARVAAKKSVTAELRPRPAVVIVIAIR
jgi:hypothetical protein